MAESLLGTTYAKLARLQTGTSATKPTGAALAELVNAQFRHPFAEHWGDGFPRHRRTARTSAPAARPRHGHINPKCGSSQGGRSHPYLKPVRAVPHQVVNVGVRDSTYVLDGLLYHESSCGSGSTHYTDTAGFTDHVFALMHLLGFRFAPRIRDAGRHQALHPEGRCHLRGVETDDRRHAQHQSTSAPIGMKSCGWPSIKQGTATASLMLRKLGGYPRQNGWPSPCVSWDASSAHCSSGLAAKRRAAPPRACRAEQRRGAQRADPRRVLQPHGEIRDRSFEAAATGLAASTVTAAIVLWNTVYLERAANALRGHGQAVDDGLLRVPVAARLGAHQPDRRLPLAQQRQDRRRQKFGPPRRCNH